MAAKKNPLKLNPLQSKTLTLLQVLAKHTNSSQADATSGLPFITTFPDPHGNHFHLGPFVVMSKDATGLRNEAVWVALTRKGLAESRWPIGIVLTQDGLDYDTGLQGEILHGSDH